MPSLHTHQRLEATRISIGAALLEVQQLGNRHREAISRLEAAYMELTELTAASAAATRAHGVEDVA